MAPEEEETNLPKKVQHISDEVSSFRDNPNLPQTFQQAQKLIYDAELSQWGLGDHLAREAVMNIREFNVDRVSFICLIYHFYAIFRKLVRTFAKLCSEISTIRLWRRLHCHPSRRIRRTSSPSRSTRSLIWQHWQSLERSRLKINGRTARPSECQLKDVMASVKFYYGFCSFNALNKV